MCFLILLQLLHKQTINVFSDSKFLLSPVNFHFLRFFSLAFYLALLFFHYSRRSSAKNVSREIRSHSPFRECRMILFKLSLVCATACEAPSSDFQSARYIYTLSALPSDIRWQLPPRNVPRIVRNR